MNWTQAENSVAPWDATGLPPRAMRQRCARHSHCAYRDDDPARCEVCHVVRTKGCPHVPDGVKSPSETLSEAARYTLELSKRVKFRVGDHVRIERDQNRFPSKGTWRWFAGRTGTIVEVNRDSQRPHLTEYGVVFGATRERPGREGKPEGGMPTWFKLYELQSCYVS